MGEAQARMERVLARLLPAAHVAPARLHEAMRYAVLGAGKRVATLIPDSAERYLSKNIFDADV